MSGAPPAFTAADILRDSSPPILTTNSPGAKSNRALRPTGLSEEGQGGLAPFFLRDPQARARIDGSYPSPVAGHSGDVRPVGEGVSELRIDYGPGCRIYYVERGYTLTVLLTGGDKHTQDWDIKTALDLTRELQETVMAKTQTRPWDVAEHLETEEDMAAYLGAALEEGDPALVAAASGDIARAKGMAQIALETGLGRESLYKALSAEGNPELATVLKVVRTLGLRLHATTERA